ncbi:MAG: zinc dependent phospholipase C family protein [Nitrospirae bacterium]|nr:zinc dependent phospholipase C family protein [Nitrospirota bacterium]MBF0591515.1 zinc dependent phospholipase C family protein [Nitrospirota bacterium]
MMMMLLITLGVVFIPSACYAWGPLTHMYLGSEILSASYLIPSAVYAIIKAYRDDFLYGNIVADIVLGKKYLPQDRSSHSWRFGFSLIDNTRTPQQRAFAYGYLSHLAADTVAHELLTNEQKNIKHTIYELQADSLIKKKYWLQAIAIGKSVQKRNDVFLENSLCDSFFSFKTNKRIFKSMVYMSLFTSISFKTVYEPKELSYLPKRQTIRELTEESLMRITDILSKGQGSTVVRIKPGGEIVHGRLFKGLFLK